MIPLKDDIPSRTFPVVTVLLIVLNVVVFLADLSLGGQLSDAFALVPAAVTHAPTAIIPGTSTARCRPATARVRLFGGGTASADGDEPDMSAAA